MIKSYSVFQKILFLDDITLMSHQQGVLIS